MPEVDVEKELESLLADSANRAILESIMGTPKSTSQICTECGIPTSTGYRKMQKLAECRAIRKIGIINESGKREILYKSNLYVLSRVLK
ncbi:MAG TPA: hypothetical protein VJ792_08350 [Candidatus Nitrosotalea sp.]|nr:hypothetical protein [Candidatus Nitrosotalea sp.]